MSTKPSRLEAKWVGRWAGKTVACIASGHSLTDDDCAMVHAAGVPTVVTNTSFRRARWADALMAHDARWWRAHMEEVRETFPGERVTCAPLHPQHGVDSLHAQPWFSSFANSGAAAISLAISAGAGRVVLLGYDGTKENGRVHWHTPHSGGLSDGMSMSRWPRIMKNAARLASSRGVELVNCSPGSIYDFPRGELRDVLAHELERA